MASASDLWSLPDHLRGQVEMELRPNEQLLWVGQPIPSLYARKAIPIVLFSIPFGGFAIFWMFAAMNFGMPSFDGDVVEMLFPLFGLPFVLVGVGMFLSPLWMSIAARRTVYVLTNERAMFIGGFWNTKVVSMGPDRLTEVERSQRSDGSGDLIFDYNITYYKNRRSSTTPVGFMSIPDVRNVEHLVQQMVEDSKNAA